LRRHAGLRDRALIGLMVYSFARIGAALGMAVEDVYTQNRRLWARLREKGGKRHAMPCHHNLEEYLTSLYRWRVPARRSQGAAVPYDRPRHRQVDPHRATPGERQRGHGRRGSGRRGSLHSQSVEGAIGIADRGGCDLGIPFPIGRIRADRRAKSPITQPLAAV
jgi:integrase